jgi:WhiB family redox-sensing transcriptional regulator
VSAELVPLAALWDWQHEGLCRTSSPELFFHPEGERGPARRWRQRRAKAVCQECPVLLQCRRHALQVGEPYGVWGGMTEEEREVARAGGVTASTADDGAV